MASRASVALVGVSWSMASRVPWEAASPLSARPSLPLLLLLPPLPPLPSLARLPTAAAAPSTRTPPKARFAGGWAAAPPSLARLIGVSGERPTLDTPAGRMPNGDGAPLPPDRLPGAWQLLPAGKASGRANADWATGRSAVSCGVLAEATGGATGGAISRGATGLLFLGHLAHGTIQGSLV